MVNSGVTTPRQAERALLLLHAPAPVRPALAALLALDDRLAELFAAGREPALRQIRLAWWRDALAALDVNPPPPEPVLAALAREVLPKGVAGTRLAAMAEGWEELLADEDRAALGRFAIASGAALFTALATLLGGDDGKVAVAGEGWAFAHLAGIAADARLRTDAAALAGERLDRALSARWPRRLRPLAMMAALARSDLAGAPPNTPARAALLWRVRLRGR